MEEHYHFSQDCPVKVFLCKVEDYPIHIHDSIEILYVLDGVADIKISFYNYTLEKDQILLINHLELHSIKKISDSCTILSFQIERKAFGLEDVIFIYDPFYYQNFHRDKLREIKKILLESAFETFSGNQGISDGTKKKIEQGIRIFTEEYQLQFFSPKTGSETMYRENEIQLERIQRINNYLYEHCHERISLEMLANKEHINKFYLTHLIKCCTGYSFQELLSIIRIEKAEPLLLETNKTIEEIVHETGFSSHRFFNKQFKEMFHLSPSEYRKKFRNQMLGRADAHFVEIDRAEAAKIVSDYSQTCGNTLNSHTEILVDLDYTAPDKPEWLQISEQIRRICTGMEERSNNNPYETNYFNDTDFACSAAIDRLLSSDQTVGRFLPEDPSTQGQCTIFTGGNGLIASNGIKKASFYAYDFISKLGQQIISISDGCIVTRSRNGVQILCCNFDGYCRDIFDEGLREREKDLECRITNRKRYTILLKNIKNKYLIRNYHFYFKNGPYQQFVNMRQPERICKSDIELINHTSFPSVFLNVRECLTEPECEIKTLLEPFDAELITIESIK